MEIEIKHKRTEDKQTETFALYYEQRPQTHISYQPCLPALVYVSKLKAF